MCGTNYDKDNKNKYNTSRMLGYTPTNASLKTLGRGGGGGGHSGGGGHLGGGFSGHGSWGNRGWGNRGWDGQYLGPGGWGYYSGMWDPSYLYYYSYPYAYLCPPNTISDDLGNCYKVPCPEGYPCENFNNSSPILENFCHDNSINNKNNKLITIFIILIIIYLILVL
jgi:hypothetical protein